MRGKSLSRTWYFIISVCLLFLSTAYAPGIRGTLRAGIEDVGINNRGQKPSFVSNALLIKLTQPAAANLKVIGEDVNPGATGLSSLDSIFREHGVKSFRSIMTGNAHRNPGAAINFWYKLTLAGPEQRLTLVEPTNDDVLNLTYSGAEPLGRLMARFKREPAVESMALDYVMQTMFVPNDPYYSTPYPTSHYGNIAQWAPQFIDADQAWDATLGDSSIIIAIVDTGIDANHPDLTGKVVLEKN
ncbi:MAG TPA: hypothetical protein VFU37_24685, partial [Pyrinomonadaceae bacterium]|nr:hypothetical protein [Pyrinomonadaceae bacterium]